MSNNTTADVTGIFSLDTNRLVGLAAKGSPDVTYLAGQDTPTSGIPLTGTLTSAQGVEIKGELAAGIARSLLIASEPPAGVDRYGPVTYSATIKNPLAVARPLEPVAIRVRFPRGACAGADYIKIRNATGAYAAFQWEPELHTRTGADISTWPDVSLRAGILWVTATLGASETQAWSVEVYETAQSNSFAASVAFTVVDANTEKITANGIEYGFTAARAWLLGSCIKLSAPFDYLLSGGGSASFSVGATPYSTLTVSNVNLVSHADVTSGANKGVVFRDFVSTMTWVIEPNAKATITHRIFANGTCRITWLWEATGAIASTPSTRTFTGRLDLNGSATTSKPYDSDLMHTARYYSAGQSVAIGCNATQQTSDAQETPFDKSFGVWDYRQILGWATKPSTTSLVAGANCYVWTWIAPDCGTESDLTNVVDAMNCPVFVFAEPGAKMELRRRVAAAASRLLSRWLEFQPAEIALWPASQGVNFLFDYLRTGNPAQLTAAKAKLSSWLTLTQNPSANGDVWFAKWLASSPTQTSIAYMGRESSLPYFLWRLTGEDQYARIVHAAADFAVKVEQWCKDPAGGNVSPGSCFLFPGDNNPVNASASVLGMIAQSLSIAGDPVRLTAAQEILAYINSSVTHKTKIPYKIAPVGTPNGVKFLQKITYFRRAGWDIAYSCKIAPQIGTFNCDMIPFLAESHNVVGMADETKWTTERNRRGLLPLEAVGIALFDGGRQALALADAICEHAEAVTTPASGLLWPVDGWYNQEPQAQNLNQNLQATLIALALTA